MFTKSQKPMFWMFFLITIAAMVVAFACQVLALPAAARPSSSPLAATWMDDFNGPALDSRWSWVREDSNAWSLSDAPGFLRISTQAGGLLSNDTKNLLLTDAPTGDFDITTQVVITPTEPFQHATLLVYQDDDNYISMNRAYLGEDAVTFDLETQGVFTYTQITVTATTLWLRISKLGNLYTGFYSLDGDSWNTVETYEVDFTDSRQVGINAANGDTSAASIPVDFESFALESPQNYIYLPIVVRAAEPSIPQLVSPANGAVLNTLIPDFVWDTGTQPAASDGCFALGTAPHPTECVMSYGLDYADARYEEVMWYNLDASTVYYWRVGVTRSGETDPVWSDEWTFTTAAAGGPVLPAPSLQSPADNSSLTGRDVTLVWQPVEGAIEYSLTLHGIDAGRWAGFSSTTDTQRVIYDFADYVNRGYGNHYEWFVQARNDYAWSASSAGWKFTYTPAAEAFNLPFTFDGFPLLKHNGKMIERSR